MIKYTNKHGKIRSAQNATFFAKFLIEATEAVEKFGYAIKPVMNKIFVIVSLILACHLPALSQNNDQFKIDSLKKALPFLHDSARVDCLND